MPRALPRSSSRAAALVALCGIPAAVALVALSAMVGPVEIALRTVWESVTVFDPESSQHQVVRNLRIPRAVAAAMVGSALAAAGAVMQGTTRNPLASPSILGVNAGAALALAVAFVVVPGATLHTLAVASMCGAALGVVTVHAVAALAPGGLSPVRLVLAGAAVTALLASVTTGLVLHFAVHEDVLYFVAGGVSGTRWDHVAMIVPWAAAGLVGAFALAPSIAVLHVGEEAATGLGLRTAVVRRLAAVVVVVLAGVAVSVAGPVAFVGLVVPHVARLLVGSDDRVVIPASAVLGAVLLALADLGVRMLHPTREVPLGMVTALVGVPVFLHLIRRHEGAAT